MSPSRNIIRLHRRKDILKVIRDGRRIQGNSFQLAWLPGGGEALRLAVVVPLMGNTAVDRNRLKRRIREAVKLVEFAQGLKGDIVLRARRKAYSLNFQDLLFEVNEILSMQDGNPQWER